MPVVALTARPARRVVPRPPAGLHRAALAWVGRGFTVTLGAVVAAVAGVVGMLWAARALWGVALVAYGAWLAWPPGGFIVGGAALVVDRLVDERRTTR